MGQATSGGDTAGAPAAGPEPKAVPGRGCGPVWDPQLPRHIHIFTPRRDPEIGLRCQWMQSVYLTPLQCWGALRCKTLALPSSTSKGWSQQRRGLGCFGDLAQL